MTLADVRRGRRIQCRPGENTYSIPSTSMETMMNSNLTNAIKNRARGCLLGQFIGDALGSLVEFLPAKTIAKRYPNGVRQMKNGGTWNLIAGQPTDDSQMAMMLIRALENADTFDPSVAFANYQHWLSTGPFDIGLTCRMGLAGKPNFQSQSNGALMRVSPLGVFGARDNISLEQAMEFARQDAELTHPNLVCVDASAVLVAGIVTAIETGNTTRVLSAMLSSAQTEEVYSAIIAGTQGRVARYSGHIGWVLLAISIAVESLLITDSGEEALVHAINYGGDTDTNAAITGALVGAVYGADGWPKKWVKTVLECRPDAGNPKVAHPLRPEFWATELLNQADRLVGLSS